MKITVKRLIIILSVCIVVAVVVLVALKDIDTYRKYNVNAARESGLGVPVKAEAVKYEDLQETIGATSTAESSDQVRIISKIEGRVEKVHFIIGDTVNQNQLLIDFDMTVLNEELKSAEDEVTSAKTKLDNSKLLFERLNELFKKQLIPKVEIENAQAELDAAKAKYSASVKNLTQIRDDIKNAKIKSPVTGIIIEKNINPGENVKKGSPLCTIGIIVPLNINAKVAEEKVGHIYIGQEAEVVFDVFPNTIIKGKIVKIDPTVSTQTKTFSPYIRIENKDIKFKPGMSAYTRFQYKKRALTIPKLSLLKQADKASVFVVEDNKAKIRHIEVDQSWGDKVEVVSGLKEGEKVIFYGLLNLKDNDPINLQTLSGGEHTSKDK